MKDLTNLLIAAAIFFGVLFVGFVVAGVLLTWYVESRWGVAGVEETINTLTIIGVSVTAVALIVVGWFIANRSHVEGARTANTAQENTAAVLVDMFAALSANQKADASMAKAIAAQAGADAQIRVLDYKAQLQGQQRALLANPDSEPVRRAPWEATGKGDDDAAEARFTVMH